LPKLCLNKKGPVFLLTVYIYGLSLDWLVFYGTFSTKRLYREKMHHWIWPG